MRAAFVGPYGRHGHFLAHNRTMFTHHPVCLQGSKKSRSPLHVKCGVTHFLTARNMKLADINHQLCEVYGEYAMNDSMVRRVRHFNEGRENANDDPRSSQPSAVNEDLVRAVEEKIQEKR
jgi:hypothetical protein